MLFSALAVTLMLGTSAFAQQNQQRQNQQSQNQAGPAQTQERLSPADSEFIKDAAIGGMFEVETGRLAERNASNPQVKQFGERMVRDHGNANAQLTAIATGKGATIPKALDHEHAQLHERLGRLHGAEFDRAYMSAMVKDHDTDAQKFAKQADNGKDEDLRRFARNTLAVIQEHDKMAHDLAQATAATGSSAR